LKTREKFQDICTNFRTYLQFQDISGQISGISGQRPGLNCSVDHMTSKISEINKMPKAKGRKQQWKRVTWTDLSHNCICTVMKWQEHAQIKSSLWQMRKKDTLI